MLWLRNIDRKGHPMTDLLKIHRQGAGSYISHTPYGTFLIKNCPVDRTDPNTQGMPSGPRWMLTYPGEYSADAVFDTKREAVRQIRDVFEWELREGKTAQELATERRNYHTEDSPYLPEDKPVSSPPAEPATPGRDETPPPAGTDESPRRIPVDLRPMLGRKLADPETVAQIHADRCPHCKGAGCPKCSYKGRRPQCVHGNISHPGAQGDPIEACRTARGTEDFGAFNDEGCFYAHDCAVDVANQAAEESEEFDGITWSKLCTEHAEQPAGTCEDCNSDDGT